MAVSQRTKDTSLNMQMDQDLSSENQELVHLEQQLESTWRNTAKISIKTLLNPLKRYQIEPYLCAN